MVKVPVTKAEKRSPLYKYFLRDLAPVPQEKQDMLANNPLTPETALQAPNLNKLFEPGYLPGEFGWTRFADGTIVCAGNEHTPVIMCHFVRPMKGGIELRTRFWMGCCVKDRKPQRFPFPPGVQMPDAAAFTLLAHNAKEFTNLAAILPEIYAEFHDKF